VFFGTLKLIQAKLLDVESGVRGVLPGFGLKVGPISRGRFEMRLQLRTRVKRKKRARRMSQRALPRFNVQWGERLRAF
jgi:hypothetical protein